MTAATSPGNADPRCDETASPDGVLAPLVVEDFSLALGGPLYQRCLRLCRVRPALEGTNFRLLAIPMFAWLPLLVSAATAGQVLGGVTLPFLWDLDVHARFLGALPLLIGTEIVVHRRLRTVVAQFLAEGLVAASDLARFDAILRSALRWRNSLVAEIVLLVAAFTLGHWLWQTQLRLDLLTWVATPSSEGATLSAAGNWYAFVSLPLLRFLLFRWYYRLAIWYRLLWQVSRLPLRVNPLHPDRTGGLAFLAKSLAAFTPLLLAHTVSLAGMIGTRILHADRSLLQFRAEIVVMLAVLVGVVTLPLLFFHAPLAAAREICTREFGLVASRCMAAFRHRWTAGPALGGEDVPGGTQLSQLADLGGVTSASERMRVVPFTRQHLLRVGVILVLPFAPLMLTLFPLEEIVRRALDIVF